MTGIEAMNIFAGTACLDVAKLAQHRNLDMTRFENLMMKEKSVVMPYEDPVTFGVNAAKPLIDSLTDEERNRIEMVITCSESAFDFGKSMSTYFHDLLGLNRNCRLFELKNACYSGVAGLQMAINFILADTSPGAKVMVIATDVSRFIFEEGGDVLSADWSFAEPSGGSGAVAMLVSDRPHVFQIDVGANGYYGYEVMDTCRPSTDSEAGDVDLSLLSYLDCCENAYREYQERVKEADFGKSFGYLAYHTPFGGMIKGAHRKIMHKLVRAKPVDIEKDFQRRVVPGLTHCQRVGNIMGATAALSLASTIDHGEFDTPKRVGVFSYGSGCCSEFFSGIATKDGQERLRAQKIKQRLDSRFALSIEQYESILQKSAELKFGTRNMDADWNFIPQIRENLPVPTLFLKRINEYHREYEWVQ